MVKFLKKAFGEGKSPETPVTEKQTELTRVPQKLASAEVGKGCFKQNVMHKRANGQRVTFNVGHKLDTKDQDYEKLSQFLA